MSAPAVRIVDAAVPVELAAAGLVCSLGYDLDTACASARAGLVRPGPAAGFRTRSAIDGQPEPITVHAARLLTDGFQDDARLVRLLQGAAADLRRRLRTDDAGPRAACYLSVPDAMRTLDGAALADDPPVRERMLADAAQAAQEGEAEPVAVRVAPLLERAWRAAGWPDAPVLAFATAAGHAGGGLALARALADLGGGRVDLAIVGGVDSWLDEDTLQWLLDTGRLKCDAHPAGFQPGEAAALLALRRAAGPAGRARIGRVAIADEPRALLGGEPSFGEATAAAIGPVLDAARGPAWFVADLNGETHRASEWGHAVVRLRPGRPELDDPPVWTPAASFGDTGAAFVPLAACVAARAAARRHAPAARALLVASSDGPARVAVALELPVDPIGPSTGSP